MNVGDELELLAEAFPLPVQPSILVHTVVLARGGDLVLFTANQSLGQAPRDLSAYGFSLAVGNPYCGFTASCLLTYQMSQRELLVTQGANTARVRAGETLEGNAISISVQELSEATSGGSCDPPPGSYRYGGFRTGG